MDKDIVRAVLDRSGGSCEICGSRHITQLHHVIGGSGKRKQHETEFSVRLLCWEHHHGKYGVHGNHGADLDLKLKQELQETYFNQGYTETKVRGMMGGRLY